MSPAISPRRVPSGEQTPTEELLNALTHGLAAVAALAGLVVLVCLSRRSRVVDCAIPLAIYATSLVVLYLSSTCYHAVRSRKWKPIFRSIDHAAIYLLIAGTYTPLMLVLVRGTWAVALVTTLWIAAIAGVVYKSLFVGRLPLLSTILYCVMGWAGLIAIRPIMTHLPLGCIAWILAGGVFYTTGIAFYRWHRLPFHHTIWHLFVIAGSAAHFVAIERYVL